VKTVFEYEVRAQPRWGYGRPPHADIHALLEDGRDRYRETLVSFLRFGDPVRGFPVEKTGASFAYWRNPHFTGLDVVALYSFLALRRPARYLEVGSGHSTSFARSAISEQGLATRITSIDPQPRAEIDALVDVNVREGLDETDLEVFDSLSSGDILLVDGTHRCLTNSDVTVFFVDVLPRLAAGVLVGIHDVFLPLDYPPEWSDRWYSEQYLLAALLLAPARRFQFVLPSAFVSRDPELHGILEPVWSALPASVDISGTAFWLETT
jgi:hypothetical protein